MRLAAAELRYEEAALLRDEIAELRLALAEARSRRRTAGRLPGAVGRPDGVTAPVTSTLTPSRDPGILARWPIGWWSAARASTTCATCRSICRATGSSSSPACRGRASRRWPSTPSTPRASAATWSRCRPTPASSWARWTSPTSTSSRGCRRPSPSTRSRPAATPGRPWARSPRSTTTCGSSTPGWAGPTAPTAAAPWPARPPSRSSTASSTCPRAPASRCWPRWCGGARGSTSALLDDLAKQGFARARVDGETVELSERATLDLARYEQHTIEVVVDRLVRRDDIRQRLTESMETALRLADGDRRDRRRRRGRDRGAHHLLRAPGLHLLRALLRGTRAPQLLVQLALRRLPGLRRAGHPVRGRSRAGGARPDQVPGRRGPHPVGGRPQPLVRPHASRPWPTSTGSRPTPGGRSSRKADRKVVLYGSGARAGAPQVPQPLRAASARSHRTTRGSSPGCSAATRSRSPSPCGSGPRPSCARSRARRAAGRGSSPSPWP